MPLTNLSKVLHAEELGDESSAQRVEAPVSKTAHHNGGEKVLVRAHHHQQHGHAHHGQSAVSCRGIYEGLISGCAQGATVVTSIRSVRQCGGSEGEYDAAKYYNGERGSEGGTPNISQTRQAKG